MNKNEILDFISNFQNEGTIDTFTNGCCYWFAHILYSRFKPFYEATYIYYNPIDNHFATMINCDLYDITGNIEFNVNEWYNWDYYIVFDKLDAKRVIDNCVNKINDVN